MDQITVIHQCSWCGWIIKRELADKSKWTDKPDTKSITTHGICETCAKAFIDDGKKQLAITKGVYKK
jgi:hypothetical protein